jgi:hypothetical protein
MAKYNLIKNIDTKIKSNKNGNFNCSYHADYGDVILVYWELR